MMQCSKYSIWGKGLIDIWFACKMIYLVTNKFEGKEVFFFFTVDRDSLDSLKQAH